MSYSVTYHFYSDTQRDKFNEYFESHQEGLTKLFHGIMYKNAGTKGRLGLAYEAVGNYVAHKCVIKPPTLDFIFGGEEW